MFKLTKNLYLFFFIVIIELGVTRSVVAETKNAGVFSNKYSFEKNIDFPITHGEWGFFRKTELKVPSSTMTFDRIYLLNTDKKSPNAFISVTKSNRAFGNWPNPECENFQKTEPIFYTFHGTTQSQLITKCSGFYFFPSFQDFLSSNVRALGDLSIVNEALLPLSNNGSAKIGISIFTLSKYNGFKYTFASYFLSPNTGGLNKEQLFKTGSSEYRAIKEWHEEYMASFEDSILKNNFKAFAQFDKTSNLQKFFLSTRTAGNASQEPIKVAVDNPSMNSVGQQVSILPEQKVKEQLRIAEEAQVKEQQRLALEATEIRRLRAEAEESKRKQAELEEQLRLAKQQNQVSPSSAMTTMANRKALVIGNDTYKSITKLLNAREDAKAIAANLTAVGYKVTLQLDLNEKEMKAALRTFSSQVQGGDEVLFFFAGHGVQLGSTNYLLPTDIGGESEAQVKDEAIQLQRVLDDMTEKKAKFTLAMIDACRDNPFKTAGRAIGGRGLAPTTAATGQMVVFSAGTGQQALDRLGNNDKNKNGVFTRTFLKEMQKPGVSIDRIVKNVRNEVAELARTVGHEQVPAIYDQVLGDFYFKK
jgi:hypothetical protein